MMRQQETYTYPLMQKAGGDRRESKMKIKTNTGTIIRTVLLFASCFNTALAITDVTQFNNPTVNLVYKILSVATNFVVAFCSHYFNNDFTEEACIGTGITRQLKAEQKEGYCGEMFFKEEEVKDEQ